MATIYKTHAPCCAYSDCKNKVGYHSQYRKANGTIGFKWKKFCDIHRTSKKAIVDDWKMARGCENVDGRHGFVCTATIIAPEQLDMHHRDGNHRNDSQDNLECICGNCHSVITVQNGDHQNRYDNLVKWPDGLLTFE